MRRRLAWMAIFKLLDNNMERIFVLHAEKIGLDGKFEVLDNNVISILFLHEEKIGLDGNF
jgi:hypothetical protein